MLFFLQKQEFFLYSLLENSWKLTEKKYKLWIGENKRYLLCLEFILSFSFLYKF